jgi:hypothetical protein
MSRSNINDELSWSHTHLELQEALNEARHMETMRNQWLGFFFTAIVGTTAIAGPRLKGVSTQSILVVAVLALILEVLSAALYLAVARLNEVARHYDKIISAIRVKTRSKPPAAIDLKKYQNPPPLPRKGRLGSLAGTKKISELVLMLGVTLFIAVLIADFICAIWFSGISGLAIIMSALMLCTGILIAGFCYWVRHPNVHKPKPKR